MWKTEKKAVISFQETAMAMLMELKCKEDGMPGRLIPLPPAILDMKLQTRMSCNA